MNQRGVLRLLAFVLFFSIIHTHERADAQIMVVGYPKRFHFTGLIELNYKNYNMDITVDGRKRETEFSTFEQRYGLGLEGYIYHPRLAVFTAGITFRDTKRKDGVETDSKNIGYDLSVTFLPYRPVALDVYARKIDYTLEGLTAGPVDATTNQYGGRLRINLKKFPSIRLEYFHMDSDFFGFVKVTEKLETDRWSFDIRGSLRPISTHYGLRFEFLDFSSPSISYNAKYISADTGTTIKKVATLTTSFSYADEEFTKILSFDASLQFRPGRRFNHYYMYEYYDSEYLFKGSKEAGTVDKLITTTDQLFTGSWAYRFTDRLNVSISLNYGLHKEAQDELFEKKWTSYGLIPSLDYRRPIAGLEFSSRYSLFLKKDERRGQYKEHDLELGLETRRFRWGTIYANYVFLKSDAIDKLFRAGEFLLAEAEVRESKTKTTTQLFRTGIRGRGLGWGPSRASWNIEGEYLHSTSSGERPITSWEGVEIIMQWSKKTSQYILFGELVSPLGRGATVDLKAGYTTGEADSKGIRRFYFDERFNYPISRRLSFSAWWMQIWDKVEGTFDRKTRDCEVMLAYRLGKAFLRLEYWVLREEEGRVVKVNKRLFLKLRRPF